MPIGIVTDSTSDVPDELAEKFDISVVPTILIINGEEHIDGQGITREEYYDILPDLDPSPTTAAPSSGTFSDTYEKAFKKGYDHLISIHVSSKLSAVYNSAVIGAESFGERITVLDSQQLTLGLGFQVIAAAEAAVEGADLEQTLAVIEDTQDRVWVYAMLDTLTQLKRSGRVSWAQASLGELLKVKLFIEVKDGEIQKHSQTRTRKKGIAQLSQMLRDLGPLDRLAMLHTNAEDEARAILEDISPEVATPVSIRNITTIVGTHVGVKALGIAGVVK